MKKLKSLSLALLVVGSVSAQTWTLDKDHAQVGFSVTHLLLSEVAGSFKTVDATITSTSNDFTNAVIQLTAAIAGVTTENEKRDTHLKGPDFFDAAQFATITFKSTSFTKVDGKNYKLAGMLTLHGITKPVVLDVVFNGTAIHPYTKKTIAGFKVNGKINRKDFKIGESTPGTIVSDEVRIHANAEFIKG